MSFKPIPVEKKIEAVSRVIVGEDIQPSLSQYKVMKEFQIPWGAEAHFNLFTLRHNFRVFPRGERKGCSPVQLEGLDVSLNEWSDLLYSERIRLFQKSLFSSLEKEKRRFSQKVALDKKMKLDLLRKS